MNNFKIAYPFFLQFTETMFAVQTMKKSTISVSVSIFLHTQDI